MAKKPTKKPTKKKPLTKKKVALPQAAKKAAKPAGKKVIARPVKKVTKVKVDKAAVKKVSAKKPSKEKEKVKVKAVPAKAVAKTGRKEKPEKNREQDDEVVVVEETVVAIEEETADELVLTDAEGRRFCRVRDCDQLASVEGYCRYHYLLHWKKIQVRKKILTEGKLERYIEELTARYPDKFLDMLRKDLRGEKEFLIAIQELEIDESATENDLEEEAQTYIDEVRGIEPAGRESEEDF